MTRNHQKHPPTPVRLVDFIGDERKDQPDGTAFSFPDYLELVDWSGRARLGIEQRGWLDMINHYDQRFFRAVGTMEKLKQFAHQLGQCWMKGQSASKCVYKQSLPT